MTLGSATVSHRSSLAALGYEVLAYVAPVALWATLLILRVDVLIGGPSLVLMLSAIQLALMTSMLAFRGAPREADRSARSLAAALLGNFLPFALLLDNPVDRFAAASEVIIAGSLALSIWAALSLRTSVSIAPANRGVRTSGPYRFVRHPMYLAVLVGQFGLLLTYPSIVNVAILVSALLFKIIMISNEERVMLRDDAYALYRKTVPFRMIPGIW